MEKDTLTQREGENGREASVLLMLCSFFHLTERKESNYDVQRLAAIGELIDSVGQTEQKDETGVSERKRNKCNRMNLTTVLPIVC